MRNKVFFHAYLLLIVFIVTLPAVAQVPLTTLDVDGLATFRRNGLTTSGIFISNGGVISLKGWGSNNPYMEWRNSDNARQGYMGWNTNRLSLVLENTYPFTIENGNMNILGSGNLGIGTMVPKARLHVPAGDAIFGGSETASLSHLNATVAVISKENAPSESLPFYVGRYTGQDLLWVRENGEAYIQARLGIGMAPTADRLTVDGTVRCEEVKVELIPGSGPDYVFEPTYNLLSLSDVESYIRANKHLPEVPSAKQMEEDGLNLKEMNLLLLKKVEELTLHLIAIEKNGIAQNKRIEEQQQEIIQLKLSINEKK